MKISIDEISQRLCSGVWGRFVPRGGLCGHNKALGNQTKSNENYIIKKIIDKGITDPKH